MWRTCFCRRLGGINVKEKREGVALAAGLEGKRKPMLLLERCSSLEDSTSWGAVGGGQPSML